MVKKGISELITVAIIFLITILTTTIVLGIGLPVIDRAKESGVINEALQNMRIINNLVREVASEGTGALRTSTIKVTGGSYRLDATTGVFEFELDMKSDVFDRATFIKEGDIVTTVTGTANTTQNSSHIVLENEILKVNLQRIGSPTSFAGINTTDNIRSIQLRSTGTTILPRDTSVQLGNVTNTSVGVGYSILVEEGQALSKAEALFHIRSNLTLHEYEILYTLPASADFLIVKVTNVSLNSTTLTYGYRLGDFANDTIKAGNTIQINVSESCYTRANFTQLHLCASDGVEFTTTHASSLIYSGDERDFEQMCTSNRTTFYNKFNLTVTGPIQAVIPFTQRDCLQIDNTTAIIKDEGLPSTPFGDYPSTGQKKLRISLQYPRIKLNGEGRFATGSYKVCVQKIGHEAGRAIVNITAGC